MGTRLFYNDEQQELRVYLWRKMIGLRFEEYEVPNGAAVKLTEVTDHTSLHSAQICPLCYLVLYASVAKINDSATSLTLTTSLDVKNQPFNGLYSTLFLECGQVLLLLEGLMATISTWYRIITARPVPVGARIPTKFELTTFTDVLRVMVSPPLSKTHTTSAGTICLPAAHQAASHLTDRTTFIFQRVQIKPFR